MPDPASGMVALKLQPRQARMVAEQADVRAQLDRQRGHVNDAVDWETIAAEAHAAADRGR